MSLRPIDLQINFLRETDARLQRTKEGTNETGQQRYAPEMAREDVHRAEQVRGLAEGELEAVKDEEARDAGGEGPRKREKKKAPGKPPAESGPFTDPTKGSIIDIRFV